MHSQSEFSRIFASMGYESSLRKKKMLTLPGFTPSHCHGPVLQYRHRTPTPAGRLYHSQCKILLGLIYSLLTNSHKGFTLQWFCTYLCFLYSRFHLLDLITNLMKEKYLLKQFVYFQLLTLQEDRV